MNITNTTQCLLQCYTTGLRTTTHNLSFDPLQCIANHVTQSTDTNVTNRTVWNIVWSSLTTIFACTWVSCHPNIFFDEHMLMKAKERQVKVVGPVEETEVVEVMDPGKGDRGDEWDEGEEERLNVEYETISHLKSETWRSSLQGLANHIQSVLVTLVTPVKWRRWCLLTDQMVTRIKIISVALIAPEFIVIWALRQYISASNIVMRFKGLTMTHAFFSLMGGFVIADNNQRPICPLVLRPTLIPGLFDLRPMMLDAISTANAKACFKICVTASKSDMASTLTGIDAATEALADTLETAVLNVVVGFGSLSVVFKYKAVLEQLRHEALDVIEEALDETKRDIQAEELDDDWTPGSQYQLQWNSRKDEMRDKISSILQDKLQSSLRDWSESIRSSLVSYPEEDIKDRSKQDWVGKTFALVQIGWFVVQCIARRVQHLPLTEIELMTCAYATLSSVIYAFWWHKPFGVQFPIIVRTKIPLKEEKRCSTFGINMWDVSTFARFLVGSVYDDIGFRRQLRVPTFYSAHCKDKAGNFWNFVGEIATAAVFGGIHLFAWNYEFPTQVELWLWRVSALVVVGVPPMALMPILMVAVPRWSHHFILKVFLYTLILLYIAARISLLVISLVSLRRLPVGTLANVDWLTFIPHID